MIENTVNRSEAQLTVAMILFLGQLCGRNKERSIDGEIDFGLLDEVIQGEEIDYTATYSGACSHDIAVSPVAVLQHHQQVWFHGHSCRSTMKLSLKIGLKKCRKNKRKKKDKRESH